MTAKTLFTIILRIFGLWILYKLIEVLAQTISAVPYLFEDEGRIVNLLLFQLIIYLIIYLVVLRLLIFKPEYIIKHLSLTRGLEEESLHEMLPQSTIIHIAIIVLGGILCILTLPSLAGNLIAFWKNDHSVDRMTSNPAFSLIIIDGFKLLAGYLLMNNAKFLTGWITNKTKQSDSE